MSRPRRTPLDPSDGLMGDLLDEVAPWAGDRVLLTGTGTSDRLPFPDASFDGAVSLHTLETVSDRGGALSELRRVVHPGGRLAVAVWGPLDENPAFSALADSLYRFGGVRAAAAVHWLSSLSRPDDLRALLSEAGFDQVRVRRRTAAPEIPSMDALLGWFLGTFPIGAAIRSLPIDARGGITADLARSLGPSAAQGIVFTTDVHAALAQHTAA
ncbi:MAG: class I SAM-dependent methyltransferase [Actinomycetota bacterium]